MDRPVLLCLARDDAASRTLAFARRLAVAVGAPVRVVHVADPEPDFVGYGVGPESVRDAVAEELRAEHRWVAATVAGLREAGVDAAGQLLRGAAAAEILAAAERFDAGWIVVGTQDRPVWREALLGSVGREVMRRATRPVVLVPPPDAGAGAAEAPARPR